MTVIIDGTAGITSPAETTVNLAYTGTLTGNGGIVNLGSGQVYKDASGNVGIGTSTPSAKLQVNGSMFVTGRTVPTSGSGPEIYWNGTESYCLSFDRTNTAYKPFTFDGSQLEFRTGGAERARIDSSGNLLVGTTGGSPFDNCRVAINTSQEGCRIKNSNSSGGISGVMFRFLNAANTTVGEISATGSATTYATSSDYRLKEAVAPMTGALAKVALLKPCTYKWKVDGSDGQGFIAHELAEVEPGCVTGEKDAVDADGNPQYQGIDTSFLVATLAAAIQELKAIVDGQAVEIAALKGAV